MVECLEAHPGKFRAIGLVDPLDQFNADQLWCWMNRGLAGFRLHPLYYPDLPLWIDSPAHEKLWQAAAETGAILQFHMSPRHAPALHRMASRHPRVRVIVDHIGKPDVTEPPPHPSFQPVLDLAALPNVWVKIGDYQIASKGGFPWRDTWPFVAQLRERFGPERMVWGTGYPRTARLVPLEQALAYVRGLPCFTPADLELVLGETLRKLFGFWRTSGEGRGVL